MLFFKRNKYIIVAYIIVIFITIFSIYNFFVANGYFDYNKIKKICYESRNMESEVCDGFTKYNWDLEEYLNDDSNTFMGKVKKAGLINLYTNVVVDYPYHALQFLSPLIISLAILGTVHELVSSGIFKYYLQRMKYKVLLRKIYKKTFLISLITPFSLLIIFLFMGFLTNFEIADASNFYQEWFINNFNLYFLTILMIQYLFNIFCVNLSLFALLSNKNTTLVILKGYLSFFIFNMFYYIVIFSMILRKILGLNISYEFFTITGFWFFNTDINYLLVIPELIVLVFISFSVLYFFYSNKEKVIMSSEFINS